MKANKTTISVGDKIIFYCDEYRDGNIMEFDGSVQSINDEGVDVLYLSGYRSRNDFILFKDIIAKSDDTCERVDLRENTPPVYYSGRLKVFDVR